MSLRVSRGRSREMLHLPRRVPTRRFIPDGDVEFAHKARNFANQIKAEPQRFALSAEDAQRVEEAVAEFRDALAKTYNRFTRSMETTVRKDAARAKAERLVRKYGTLIRLNDEIDAADKTRVGVRVRSKPVRREQSISVAPALQFVGTSDPNTAVGHQHMLRFWDCSDGMGRTKPQWATRLELFVELVDPAAPIPKHPAEISGGRTWYLRSYTRSPIRVDFPVADRPMRVVYWARWADSRCNAGPFCRTVVARVEGREDAGLALPDVGGIGRPREQRIVITSAMKALTDARELDEACEAIRQDIAGLLPDATE